MAESRPAPVEYRAADFKHVEAWVHMLEDQWGMRPVLVLACYGYADQHWQAYRAPSGTNWWPDAVLV